MTDKMQQNNPEREKALNIAMQNIEQRFWERFYNEIRGSPQDFWK